MKKLLNHVVFFCSLFLIFIGKSYSQADYKTDLLNHVWSANCNESNYAVLYTLGSNSELIRIYFKEGKIDEDSYQFIKKIEYSGESFINIHYVDKKNRLGTDTIEFKNDRFRNFNRVIDGEQIIKSGKRIKDNTELSYLNKCSSNSSTFIMVNNLTLIKNSETKTSSKNIPNSFAAEFLNYAWSSNCNNAKLPIKIFLENSNNEIKYISFTDDQSPIVKKVKSIESKGEFIKIDFNDENNKANSMTILLKEQGFRIYEYVLNGDRLIYSGKQMGVGSETNFENKCSANSKAYAITQENWNFFKTAENQQVQKRAANSYAEACYGSDRNSKKIKYSDGTKAEAYILFSGRDKCGCLISLTPNEKFELYPNYYSDIPNELVNIYESYAPFYGCPNDSDYLKFVQILKAEDVKRNEARRKADEEIKIEIQKLIESNKQFCKGIPKTKLNVFEYMGKQFRTNPDEINLKRVQPSDEYLGCTAIYYSPRGPVNCQVLFDDKGVIANVDTIGLTIANKNILALSLGLIRIKQGCE